MWMWLLGARMMAVMSVVHGTTGERERGNNDGNQCFHVVKRKLNFETVVDRL